jgi:hypothetical protein
MRLYTGVALLAILMAISIRADLHPSGASFVSSQSNVIISATTTTVKATGGTLRRVIVTTPIASGTVKLFDLASASCTGTPSTNPKAIISIPSAVGNPFYLEFQQSFTNGICALTSTGTWNLTVIYD